MRVFWKYVLHDTSTVLYLFPLTSHYQNGCSFSKKFELPFSYVSSTFNTFVVRVLYVHHIFSHMYVG